MTAGERLKQLAGAGGVAASLLLSIGSGATAAEALVDYSGLDTGSAATHLLTDVATVPEVVTTGATRKQLFTGVVAAETRLYGYSATAYGGDVSPEAGAGIYPRVPAVTTAVTRLTPEAAASRAIKTPASTALAVCGTVIPDGGAAPDLIVPELATGEGAFTPSAAANVLYIRIGDVMWAKVGHINASGVRNPTDEELAILAVQLARRSRR